MLSTRSTGKIPLQGKKLVCCPTLIVKDTDTARLISVKQQVHGIVSFVAVQMRRLPRQCSQWVGKSKKKIFGLNHQI
jgi:hypothetical protein